MTLPSSSECTPIKDEPSRPIGHRRRSRSPSHTVLSQSPGSESTTWSRSKSKERFSPSCRSGFNSIFVVKLHVGFGLSSPSAASAVASKLNKGAASPATANRRQNFSLSPRIPGLFATLSEKTNKRDNRVWESQERRSTQETWRHRTKHEKFQSNDSRKGGSESRAHFAAAK